MLEPPDRLSLATVVAGQQRQFLQSRLTRPLAAGATRSCLLSLTYEFIKFVFISEFIHEFTYVITIFWQDTSWYTRNHMFFHEFMYMNSYMNSEYEFMNFHELIYEFWYEFSTGHFLINQISKNFMKSCQISWILAFLHGKDHVGIHSWRI